MPKRPAPIADVRAMFEREGCKLVSTEYFGSKLPLLYMCNCGSTFVHTTSAQAFRLGSRCPECKQDRLKRTMLDRYGVAHMTQIPEKKAEMLRGIMAYVDDKRYTLDEVRALVEDAQCELLSNEYVENKAPLQIKFQCGCMGTTSLNKFLAGHRCSTRECMTKRKVATNLTKFGVEWYRQTSECTDSYRATCMAKYGVDHASKAPSTLAKAQETCEARFNVPSYFMTPEFKARTKARCLDDFGVCYYAQTDHVKARIAEVNLERYGVPVSSQNPDVHARMLTTNLERYGVPYTLMNPDVKAKADAVILERFGVRNVSQNAEVHSRRLATLFSSKPFTFPSGRVVTVQGYEGLAITLLLAEGVAETDVEVDARKMPTYNYVGVDAAVHRYFPDLWIAKDNLIVEVKSKYTYEIAREVTELKRQSVEAAGQKYRLMIMDPKGNLLN